MSINIKSKALVEPPAPKPKSENSALSLLEAMSKDKGASLFVMGDKIPLVERIPTGIFEFDLATGGGFPRGRVSIVTGREASGKSTMALLAGRTVQGQDRPDNKVVYIDLEGTLEPSWSGHFIDMSKLLVAKPRYGEEASDMMDAIMHADDVGLIVMDSIAVMSASKELDKSAEDFLPGRNPFIVNEMIRKLTWGINNEGTKGHRPAIILVNQPRMKIGTTHPTEYLPGGALQTFATSLTVRMTGTKVIEKAINPLLAAYNEVSCIIKKAKVGVTRQTFDFKMATIEQEHLKIGSTDSWNTVKTALQSFDLLKKVPSGWSLAGHIHPTQAGFQTRYQAEPAYAVKLQQMVVERSMGSAMLIG